MNLVQSVIRGYLSQGLTQTALAERLGISAVQLNYVLNGHRPPSPNLLKALGIERHIVYVHSAAPHSPPVIHTKPSKQRRKEAPKQIEIAEVNPKPSKPKASAIEPKLTADRVQIALKFKLKPGYAWATFLTDYNPAHGEIDSAWLTYCQTFGSAQANNTQTQEKQLFASLGRGDAVELKAQTARNDFRKPLQPGQLRIIPQTYMPEAPKPSMTE